MQTIYPLIDEAAVILEAPRLVVLEEIHRQVDRASLADRVLEDGRVAGVVIYSGDGGRQTIRSKVVIDASGQRQFQIPGGGNVG